MNKEGWKRKMTEKTLDEILFEQVKAEVKPGASLQHIKSDLERVEPQFFAKYDGKPVAEAKLEDSFNDVATKYVSSLWGASDLKNANGPTWYGNLMRGWLGLVSEQAFGQVKAAIKQGNRAEVLRLFNQAYEAQANKLTSLLNKIREQPSDVQLGTYKHIAKVLGDGNVAKVASNPGAAVQSLAQIYATQDAYK